MGIQIVPQWIPGHQKANPWLTPQGYLKHLSKSLFWWIQVETSLLQLIIKHNGPMPKTNPFDPNMLTGRGWLLVPSGQFLWHKRWKMFEDVCILLLKMVEEKSLKMIVWRILFIIYWKHSCCINWKRFFCCPSRPCWSSLDILLGVQHQLAPLPNPVVFSGWKRSGASGNGKVVMRRIQTYS